MEIGRMDNRQTRRKKSISQTLDKCFTKLNNFRCNNCGKVFETNGYLHICKECLSKKRKESVNNYYKTNEHQKIKWGEKIGLIKIDLPTIPEWDILYNPVETTEKCSFCGETHKEDQVYYHKFMQKADVFGIPIMELEILLKDVKKELRAGIPINKILEKRGLDMGNLIKMERD